MTQLQSKTHSITNETLQERLLLSYQTTESGLMDQEELHLENVIL